MKSKVNAVYGDVYSTVEVFLISRNGYLIGALKSFSEWFECKEPQPAITCSKLTIEALEQGLKYVQS